MQTQQGNMLQSLRNVEVFLDQNAERLAEVVRGDVRQRLTDAVTALNAHVSAQSDSTLGSRGATQQHRALRRALIRDHMLPIARIAAADLPNTPEVQPLRMPPSGVPVQKLAAAAYGMAETASRYSEVFTKAFLPADFVAQLTAAADLMIASLAERTKSRLVKRDATASLKAKLAAARKVVGVLDAAIRSRFKDEPGRLLAWASAKRVERVRRVPTATAPTPPVTPAQSPTAPTT
jgi:hypothetical protein